MSNEEEWPSARTFFGEDVPNMAVVDDLSFETIVSSIEEKIDKEGWDQAPTLAFIRGNELGAETLQLMMPDEINENFSDEFPRFVNQLMEYIITHRAEGPHSDFVRMLQENFLGPSFQGILLSTEGWTVPEPNKESEPEKWAQWRRAVDEGLFHQHEDRVEVRVTVLLTCVSDMYQVKRIRGEEPEQGFADGENWEWGKFGSITELLRVFMRACIAMNLLQGLADERVTEYWQREYERARQWVEERGWEGPQ